MMRVFDFYTMKLARYEIGEICWLEIFIFLCSLRFVFEGHVGASKF